MATFIEHDFDPRNLPPELLQAIGLMVAASAQTESVVETAIAACAGIDPEYGLALSTHMAGPQRDNALRALAEIRIDDLSVLDSLDKLLDAIKAASEKRNAIVHRTWLRHGTDGKPYTVKTAARGSVSMDLVPTSTEQVLADAMEMYQAGMDLMAFMQVHDLMPCFPLHRPRGHKTRSARKKGREKSAKVE